MSVSQPDVHREMLARVKEFDGDDDKWPGSFLKANHIGYEALIERIAQVTDATALTNTALNDADKKLSSSLCYVLGLIITDESKSLNIVRNVAVGRRCSCSAQVVGGVSARHRQPSPGSVDDDHEMDDSRDRSDQQSMSWIRKSLPTNCKAVIEWQTQ